MGQSAFIIIHDQDGDVHYDGEVLVEAIKDLMLSDALARDVILAASRRYRALLN